MTRRITIRRPDDWHLHLRDGAMLEAVLPATSAVFGRAIVMPNLKPPVRTMADLRAYRGRILGAIPPGHRFEPLMTLYLTEASDPADIAEGAASGELAAVKLYPAGATTNSDAGVRDFGAVRAVLGAMERADVPLLVHGEVTDPAVDIFDREAVFIERVLIPLRREHPGLRVVLEHVTTAEGVAYVGEAEGRIGGTITPHHLMINRTDIFRGGIRPHLYCLPIAKRESHRLALRDAATGRARGAAGRFFLGTDSAPHPVGDKESDCGCAGVFNAPVAMACLAEVFDADGALDRLEAFASLNGPAFYGRTPAEETITLEREAPPETLFVDVAVAGAGGRGGVRVFRPDAGLSWRVAGG